MEGRDRQQQNEDPVREGEPEVSIEYSCPIEELAVFISSTREKDGDRRRTQFTPEQAKERLQGFIDQPGVIEIVLRKNKEVIGCAFSYEVGEKELKKSVPYANFFNKTSDRIFKVREVNVDPIQRNKGFGQMIMERIMLEAKQRGATKLVLSTYPEENDPANKLYKKLGFEEVAPNQDERNYYMMYEFSK